MPAHATTTAAAISSRRLRPRLRPRPRRWARALRAGIGASVGLLVAATGGCAESRDEGRGLPAPDPLAEALEDADALEARLAPLVATEAPDVIADRYIVVLDKDASPEDLSDLMHAGPTALADASIHHVYRAALTGFAATLDPTELDSLRADPRVAYVEADREVSANAVPWGLDRIDQESLPLDGAYDSGGLDGTGVHAYVVDTGIRATHVVFEDRVGDGFSAYAGGTNDCDGHGTHVAGTVGGTAVGVAPGVTLHAVRVLDCDGKGTTSAIAAGLDWVRQNHPDGAPGVVNMSLSGGGSWVTDWAVGNVIDAGIPVVAAAGNDNADACSLSPARVEEAITVGATRYNDVRWWSSNWGSCLDLFAPGSAIQSAYASSDQSIVTLSGTSMAAPHVAGAVALYLQENPEATPAQVWQDLAAVATPGKVVDPKGSVNLLLSAHVPIAEPEPEPEPEACPGCESFAGALADKGSAFEPEGTWFQTTDDATLFGVLSGPEGADFDLELWQWDGSAWQTIESATSVTSQETIQRAAPAGFYVWKVLSYSGSGDYELQLNRP